MLNLVLILVYLESPSPKHAFLDHYNVGADLLYGWRWLAAANTMASFPVAKGMATCASSITFEDSFRGQKSFACPGSAF